MEDKFQLRNYTPQIRKIAEANEWSTDLALQKFVENLTTMKEHYKGASELNYHELGQQWNRLLSKEKVAQRADTQARLSKYSGTRGKT